MNKGEINYDLLRGVETYYLVKHCSSGLAMLDIKFKVLSPSSQNI